MSLKTRIIPTILIKNGLLVKGKQFNSWRSVGGVLQAIKVYSLRQVDEMIVLNVHSDQPDIELISEIASECFVPLTVGGGIRTIDDIRGLLKAGADKVAINTAAYDTPELISEAVSLFGRQCIVVSIDVKNGECYKSSGTVATGHKPEEWAQKMEKLGAGEILVTSIEQDGTMEGYDHNLIRKICLNVSIPVIASGGAKSCEDFFQALTHGAAALAAASIYHFTQITPLEVKTHLKERGVFVRL